MHGAATNLILQTWFRLPRSDCGTLPSIRRDTNVDVACVPFHLTGTPVAPALAGVPETSGVAIFARNAIQLSICFRVPLSQLLCRAALQRLKLLNNVFCCVVYCQQLCMYFGTAIQQYGFRHQQSYFLSSFVAKLSSHYLFMRWHCYLSAQIALTLPLGYTPLILLYPSVYAELVQRRCILL